MSNNQAGKRPKKIQKKKKQPRGGKKADSRNYTVAQSREPSKVG